MAIRCGCCGGVHDTPAEVRSCCAGSLVPVSSDADSPRVDDARSAADAGVWDEPGAWDAGPPADDGRPPDGRRPPHDRTPPHDRRSPDDRARADDRPVDWRRLAGPDVLGRNLVLPAGAAVPAPWASAARLRVDGAVLAHPGPAIGALRSAAAQRERVVVELAVPFEAPLLSVERRPLHELGPEAELPLDDLHHLAWVNSVAALDVERPRWPWASAAVALGARAGDATDVTLPDGREAWIDGGPVRPWDDLVVVHRIAVEHGSLQPLGPNRTSADLAADQLAAVTHPGGAARIIAPAGSGKTRVLTERARLLLQGWGLPPSAVALVAFNRRAQQEMQARTSDLPGLQVRTLNAIALAIVNGDRPFARQPRRFQTIDEPTVRDHLARLVKVQRRTNTDPYAPYLEALSAARLGLADPDVVEDRYDGDVAGFATAYPRYRRLLDERGQLDFDEQVVRAIELLLADPDARRAAQRACRLLLVDEFQDLTPAHLLLVRLLAGPDLAVFGVGDDDQTIYGYNGADPAWLIDYRRWFPGAGDHPLQVNYRCPPGVVAAADTLLRHNARRVDKVIRAARQGEAGWVATQVDDTAAATVQAVTTLLAHGVEPTDVAVLARVNVVLAPVQVALAEQDVPVVNAVGVEVLERTAIRAALAWLRLATSSGGWVGRDLGEAVRRPSRALHPTVSGWVGEQRDLASLRRLAGRITNERDAGRVAAFADDLEMLTSLARRGATTAELLEHLIDRIGLGGAVATLDVGRVGTNRAAQADDLEALRRLGAMEPDPLRFGPALRALLQRPSDPGGVTLATVHRVKGQEWPYVVVHHADEHQFPHRLADDVEEERRVFHVAITRAAEHLTIVATRTPSPFLAELTSTAPSTVRTAAAPRVVAPVRASAADSPRAAADDPLVVALRTLRNELRGTKPAYTVFDDATLHRIALGRPRTAEELARIKGIGPARREAYGDAILATVEDVIPA